MRLVISVHHPVLDRLGEVARADVLMDNSFFAGLDE
jgi:hypothetical protein